MKKKRYYVSISILAVSHHFSLSPEFLLLDFLLYHIYFINWLVLKANVKALSNKENKDVVHVKQTMPFNSILWGYNNMPVSCRRCMKISVFVNFAGIMFELFWHHLHRRKILVTNVSYWKCNFPMLWTLIPGC